MRTVFIALLLSSGILLAEDVSTPPATGPVPKSRYTYPTGGFNSPAPSIVDEQNNPVFDLPETRQPAPEAYTKDGRPVADQSPLNTERLADIEITCRDLKAKGSAEGYQAYRKCVKDEKRKAVAEIQTSFEKTSQTKERPLRKTDAAPPLIEDQRNANRALDEKEND